MGIVMYLSSAILNSSVSLLRHIIASSDFVNPSFSLSDTLAFHSAKYPRKFFCSHCKMCTCIKHESFFFSFRYTCLYIIGIIGAVISYSTYIESKLFTTEVGPKETLCFCLAVTQFLEFKLSKNLSNIDANLAVSAFSGPPNRVKA